MFLKNVQSMSFVLIKEKQMTVAKLNFVLKHNKNHVLKWSNNITILSKNELSEKQTQNL